MATSGSTDYDRTRNELISGILRLIGKAGRGKTPSSADIDDTAEALELWIKHNQKDLHLWKLKEATLFVTKGTSEYDIPGSNITLSYVSTEIKVAASSGAGTVDVDSISGISNADYIGIEQDDGTVHWTTVNGAPAGDTVALTDVLTDDVAIDNTVYAYTTQLIRPLKALSARRVGTNDVPIDVVSREEYYRLPSKSSTGEVNEVYYDPQLTTGKLHIWPTGNASTDRVQITFMMPIEDFDSSNINPDLPQEWLRTIKYNVAADLGPEYGIKLDRQMYLDAKAEKLLMEINEFDEETTSVFFEIE